MRTCDPEYMRYRSDEINYIYIHTHTHKFMSVFATANKNFKNSM